ncbi:hypothetical protein [Actinomadura miaoliensis]|uniref:hypothetical protein n=1 Tax=Actinomadura miaoliensis TaxID=430685 RepID=UPI0031F0BCE8
MKHWNAGTYVAMCARGDAQILLNVVAEAHPDTNGSPCAVIAPPADAPFLGAAPGGPPWG